MNFRVLAALVGAIAGLIIGATVVAPRLTSALNAARTVSDPPTVQETKPGTADESRNRVQWTIASSLAIPIPAAALIADGLQSNLIIASGGRLSATVSPPGFLVPVTDTMRAVASGAIDAAITVPGQHKAGQPVNSADPDEDAMDAALALFGGYPFGPDPVETLAWMNAGGTEHMNALYAPDGIHALPCGLTAAADGGWFRDPVVSPDDLIGRRVRASGFTAGVLRRLGAEPITMNADETQLALTAGGLDASVQIAPNPALSDTLSRATPIAYFPAWQRPATVIVLAINADKWSELTPAVRSALDGLCAQLVIKTLGETEATLFSALKALTADGADIRGMTPATMAALEAAWIDIVSDVADDSSSFRTVWSELQSFRQDYAIGKEIRAGHSVSD